MTPPLDLAGLRAQCTAFFAKIHSQMFSQPKRKFAPCGDRAESLKKWEEAAKDAI